MATKITKTLKQEVIAFHFAKSNQRLTNLKKVTTDKLDEIIKRHNIDLHQTLKEYNEYTKEMVIKRNEEQIARLQEQIKENNIIESYLIKYQKLIESDKVLIRNVIIAEENKSRDKLRRHDEMFKQRLTNDLGLQFNGDTANIKPGCDFIIDRTYDIEPLTLETFDETQIQYYISHKYYNIRQSIDELSSAPKPKTKPILVIEGEDDDE